MLKISNLSPKIFGSLLNKDYHRDTKDFAWHFGIRHIDEAAKFTVGLSCYINSKVERLEGEVVGKVAVMKIRNQGKSL